MGINHFPSTKALRQDSATGILLVREWCGLTHECQILTVECPDGVPKDVEVFSFRDSWTGREFPAQRSKQDAKLAFVQIELRAHEEHRLTFHAQVPDMESPVTIPSPDEHGRAIISNGQWAADVFIGEWQLKSAPGQSSNAPVPIKRVRIKNGAWRGNVFFDTIRPVTRVSR